MGQYTAKTARRKALPRSERLRRHGTGGGSVVNVTQTSMPVLPEVLTLKKLIMTDGTSFVPLIIREGALEMGGDVFTTGQLSAGGRGTATARGSLRLDCELYVKDGWALYVSIPHGSAPLDGVVVEIARNLTQRNGYNYRAENWNNRSGWFQFKPNGTYVFEELELSPKIENTPLDKDSYEVLISGHRKQREHCSYAAFDSMLELARTFLETGKGESGRGNGIRHGRHRVKRAKWGIRLKKGDVYITGWMPFHLVYDSRGDGAVVLSK